MILKLMLSKRIFLWVGRVF